MRYWHNGLTWLKQLFEKAYPLLITGRSLYFNWIWLLIGGYGVYLVFMNTPHGIGVTHDTINYFSAAEHFIKGHGLYTNFYGEWKPLTIYQPLYPMLLGLLSFGVFSIEDTALVLNAVLMGLNTVMVFYLTAKASNYTFPAATLSAIVFLFSHFTAPTHLMAWTEPLFLCFTLTGFWFFDRSYAKSRDMGFKRYLSMAGFFIALALMTRYAGLVLLPVLVLAILITNQNRLFYRIKAAGIFLFPSLLLVGGWLLRNLLLTGNPASRSIAFTAFPNDLWQQFQNTLISIYFGSKDGILWFWLSVAITGLLLFTALVAYLKQPNQKRLQGTFGLFALGYISFLLLLPFLGNPIPFGHRLLLPFFVAISISGVAGLFNGIKKLPYKGILYIILIGLAIPWLNNLKNYGDYFMWVSRDRGLGFNSEQWQEKVQLTYARNLPKEAFIFAPKPQYKYAHYLTGRTIYPMDSLSSKMAAKEKEGLGYVLYTDPCCKHGKTPSLPEHISINKTVIDQRLYRVQFKK